MFREEKMFFDKNSLLSKINKKNQLAVCDTKREKCAFKHETNRLRQWYALLTKAPYIKQKIDTHKISKTLCSEL